MEIRVELRPSRGKSFSPRLGAYEVTHAQKEVWYSCPTGPNPSKWYRWGLIADHPGAPLNCTQADLTESERRALQPIILQQVEAMRKECLRAGDYYNPPMIEDDDDEDTVIIEEDEQEADAIGE